MLAAAFAWGSLAATTLAISANTALFDLIAKLGSQSLADRWGAAIAGPIDEETLKAIGLLLLVPSRRRRDRHADRRARSTAPSSASGSRSSRTSSTSRTPPSPATASARRTSSGSCSSCADWSAGVWSHAAYTGPRRPRDRLPSSAARMHPRALRVALAAACVRGRLVDALRLELALARQSVRRRLLAHDHRPERRSRGCPASCCWPGSICERGRRGALGRAGPRARGGDRRGDAPETESLLTFHGRRGERRAAGAARGRAGAARRTRELQRQQVGLAVELTRSRGVSTPEVERRRRAIASIRDALTTTRPSVGRREGLVIRVPVREAAARSAARTRAARTRRTQPAGEPGRGGAEEEMRDEHEREHDRQRQRRHAGDRHHTRRRSRGSASARAGRGSGAASTAPSAARPRPPRGAAPRSRCRARSRRTSPKRDENGTASRNANSTWTPGSTIRSSCRS